MNKEENSYPVNYTPGQKTSGVAIQKSPFPLSMFCFDFLHKRRGIILGEEKF